LEEGELKCNILVFPGGTEIGLEIHKGLSQCKDIRIFSAGSDVANHAPYVFTQHDVVPAISDSSWIDSLNKIVIKHEIDYIFPAHDDVVLALARNVNKMEAKIVSSPLQTCLVARSKSKTYDLMSNVVPTPDLFKDQETMEYPVFVKPDKGQGSQHIHLVSNSDQLNQLLKENREYIAMEYLPGEEYTIDCFSDRDAGLLFCSGRQRIRTRSGISLTSKTVHNNDFIKYADKISKKLIFHGAWFFQLKKDRYGKNKLLEIAPRIAGTMAVHRVKGVNFALLSIYEQERIPVEILINKCGIEIDRALVNRYRCQPKYSTVYVDLDDTLILNDLVNINLIRFLYQCINKNIRVVLITKHNGDLDQSLKKHRLAGIFDEIIQIEPSANKTDYIREKDAILIDDSFSERKAASERLGIFSFDCSMIEMLIDERL
jgi:hypothetical protein